MTKPSGIDARLRTRILEHLAYDYDQWFTRDEVTALFDDSLTQLTSTIVVTAFVPVLAEKLTRQRLDAKAQADGKQPKRVPEVLFVCTHNAGRSQMAAALAHHYAGDALHIRTGGSAPGGQIHPEVAHAMKQIGLSLDEEFPKPLTDEVVAAADVVVTMGCGDECPYLPGRRYEDWPIADPAGRTEQDVAAIRNDVDDHVRELLTSLLPELALPVPTRP